MATICIKRLERMSGSHREGSFLIAKLYFALKEKELAVSWLERGFEAGGNHDFLQDRSSAGSDSQRAQIC